jgi:hypothetical protein
VARLIDGYAEGFVEKDEFEPRVARLRQRLATLDEQARQLADTAASQRELRLMIGRLEDFAARVSTGLEATDWLTRREIIRTLVSRVEVHQQQVNVVFRVPPNPFVSNPAHDVLQHCGRGDYATLRSASVWVPDGPVLHAGVQPLPDQTEKHAVTHPASQKRLELRLVKRVEKPLDVQFDNPPAPKARQTCSAWCADRPGRNPYEHSRKSCS